MQTILHIIERLSLGGASRALIGLSKYSRQQGAYRHRVISLLPAQAEAVALAEEDGVEWVGAADRDTVEAECLAADLVQVHWWNGPALQSLLRNGLPPCRLMIWCHVVGDTLPNVITPSLIDFSDLTIASNAYTYGETTVFRSMSPELRRKKTGMIVDPTDFDRVKRVKPIDHAGFNVGYIGTVGFYKMHRDFVALSSAVDVPDVRFLVCGGGVEAQLRWEAEALGTVDRFDFLGYREDIAEIISRLDVYGYPLCPDTYASGELNLQEVMYAGVPPVVFPYGGVSSLVIDNYTGLVVETHDEYVEALEYLYHHPDERRRLGSNAASFARQMFGAEHAAQKLNAYYETLLSEEKRVREGYCPLPGSALVLSGETRGDGGRLFAESLGVADSPFVRSLESETPEGALVADESIQAVSPVVHIGGILEYRNQYPRDPWLAYWAGLALLGDGQWEPAVATLKQAQSFGLNHWRLYWFQALAYRKLERLSEASEALQLMRSLNPGFDPALTENDDLGGGCPFPVLAPVLDRERRAGRAEVSLGCQLAAESDRANDFLGPLSAAEKAWRENDVEGVDSALETLHEAVFEDAGEYFRLGQIQFNRGRFSAAVTSFEAGLQRGEGSVRVLTQLAACSLELDRIDAFESYLDRAMKLDSTDPLPHKLLAHLNVGQGRYVDAARGCRDLLAIDPQDVETLSLLAECFAATGDGEAERATYEEILCWDPENKKALEGLSQLVKAVSIDPLVSVIVSTYNGERFIRACLDDLLRQSIREQMEIIVVDSGSEEQEAKVVAEYQAQYPGIRFVRTESRETLYAAWNRALEMARGRYVVNANTDDSRRSDAFEKLAEAMNDHPEAALAYADCVWTDVANDVFPIEQPLRSVSYPSYHPALPLFYCYSGCLQFWRTTELKSLGGFDSNYRAAGDYEVLMRLAKSRMPVVHVPEILSGFYQNRTGLTQQSTVSAEEESAAREVFRRDLDVSWLYDFTAGNRVEEARAWSALGCFAREMRVPWHDQGCGDDGFALTCFRRALTLDSNCEAAAANLLVILGEHDQIELGRRFFQSGEIGWSDSRWKEAQQREGGWVSVDAKWAVPDYSTERDRHEKPRETCRKMPSIRRRIEWQAPILNPSGYGSEALNFVVPLAPHVDLGVRHNSTIVSRDFVDGLLVEDRRQLDQLVPRKGDAVGEILICHGPPSAFDHAADATYRIGRTMFETDRLPLEWVQRCNLMDEIWVPTEFNRQTFVQSGVEARKIVVIPGAVDETHFDPACHQAMVLPNRAAVNFLAVFEWIWRKGWDVLLRAYFSEFSRDDDVCLYLRSYACNSPDGDAKSLLTQRVVEFAASMGLEEADLPRFEILANQIPYRDLPSLYQAVDCLVAPSRGEGWGRPHHEAMMMGVPVIATNWSGNTEFMNEENSYLLEHRIVPVEGVEPNFEIYCGHRWAEPSVAHLKSLLRGVVASPEEVSQKGRLARAQILAGFSRAKVAERVCQQLAKVESRLESPVARLPVLEVTPSDEESRVPSLKRAIEWVGPYSDLGSLSQVNRRVTQALEGRLGRRLQRIEPGAFSVATSRSLASKELKREEDSRAPLTIRHQWPPNFTRREGTGSLVLVQPWEFGALPKKWVEQSDAVDQFWVYSEYVRRVYVDSGVDPNKVKILPLGVDSQVYHPDQEPLTLPTRKQFKFLFVGGTIGRKGPDVLLAAYGEAFSAADDVALVIKDFGGQSVYAGQTFEAQIDAFRECPENPEVVYLKAELSESEVAQLYVACDCLVHPYRGEGFGLPVLEAMASGLPVVVTRGGACDDFTPDDCAYGIDAEYRSLGRHVGEIELVRDGWLLEPSRVALVRTLRQVVENPQEARAKGTWAARYARESWAWERTADRVLVLVSEHLKKPEGLTQERQSVRERHQKAIALPACARVGDLSAARALFSKNRFAAAWDAACHEVSVRPFHPEAYLLLCNIALRAGDEEKVQLCARRLNDMVPRWAPAKQLNRKLGKRRGRVRQRESLGLMPEWGLSPRLSVCLIARDEEAHIGRCLDSVRQIADEIILVDTGSRDRTKEIAREKGAVVHECQWADDFSQARNETLKYVTGDWVLVLDADEVLAPDAGESIRQEIAERRAIGFRLPLENEGADEWGTAYVPRLFRNAPGLFYVGRIHEQIFSSVEVRRRQWGMENHLGTSRLIHFGYSEEMTRDRDKVARNLKLLRLAVEEIPNDPNLLMNLGLELGRSGDERESLLKYREAYEAMQSLPKEDVVPELRETLLTQFGGSLIRHQLFEEAREVLCDGTIPEAMVTSSILFLKGMALMRTGDFESAVDAFRDCRHKRDDATRSNGYQEAYGPAPSHCEALCLLKLGQEAEARQAFQVAVEDPGVTWAIVKDFAVHLKSAGLVLEALTFLNSKLAQFGKELAFWRLGAAITLELTDSADFALDWLGEAMRHHGEHPGLTLDYVQACLQGDRTELPQGWFETIKSECDSAPSWAIRLLGGLLENRSVEGIVPVPERELSFAVLRLYRRLLNLEAEHVLSRINDRLDLLDALAPTAAGMIRDAIAEAKTLSV